MKSASLETVAGWHDSHCASAVLVDQSGKVLFAAAEERYTKKKLQKGMPRQSMADLAARFPEKIAHSPVCYVDMPLVPKVMRNLELVLSSRVAGLNTSKSLGSLAATWGERLFRGQGSGVVGSGATQGASGPGLGFDLLVEHHTAHAASAYYCSGFPKAMVVTLDGVGDALSATVFDGVGSNLTQKAKYFYNEMPLGANYEVLTGLLGFNPDRHCGKITGLSARGQPNPECLTALARFFEDSWKLGARNWFDRLHDEDEEAVLRELRQLRQSRFGGFNQEDLAWAIQEETERRALALIMEHAPVDVAHTDICLAGGVFANVRVNQKVKGLGFRNVFVQPAMDDGGLSLGAALYHLGKDWGVLPRRLDHCFLGPSFDEEAMREAIERRGLGYERIDNIHFAIARLVEQGMVVARFDGAMEFGPRALGNRSILYHTVDPSVNTWLNKRLARTEFMPFAPATLIEKAHECYLRVEGCEHAAEFMTITFDCTEGMKRTSPAVVHVDGTARGQLVDARVNPGFHEILREYHKVTGIPSLVNTSFNMHEAPIVATPDDAVASFLDGRLDCLAMGPFLVRSKEAGGHKTSVSD
ncbi:MAG: carbamoyltransferase [Magnetococcales bacterium]|nr:carbamoyltransferase [Magnetococcales bacterium]MBF0150196.1 carbamoyltransferase [Magnetococcales bacterium]